MNRRLDMRGLAWFLGVNFTLTWGIEIYMTRGLGIRFATYVPTVVGLIVAAVMWVPAFAAVVARWATGAGFRDAGWRLGPLRAWIGVWAGAPLAFAAAYGLSWALGLGRPDWTLTQFAQEMADLVGPTAQALPPARVLLIATALSTVTVAPFINGLFAFGEEFGWQGYLLPRLLPLGPLPAVLITGVIWGLWHAPLVLAGFNYPGHPVLGVIFMCLLAILLTVYQAYLRVVHGSVLLPAWLHGSFNSQHYGIWRILFVGMPPLVGGMMGVVGLVVLALPLFWVYPRYRDAVLAGAGLVGAGGARRVGPPE